MLFNILKVAAVLGRYTIELENLFCITMVRTKIAGFGYRNLKKRNYFYNFETKVDMFYLMKHLTNFQKRSCTIYSNFIGFWDFCVTWCTSSVVTCSCRKPNWWLGIGWFYSTITSIWPIVIFQDSKSYDSIGNKQADKSVGCYLFQTFSKFRLYSYSCYFSLCGKITQSHDRITTFSKQFYCLRGLFSNEFYCYEVVIVNIFHI